MKIIEKNGYFTWTNINARNLSAEEHSNKLDHENTGAEAVNDIDLSAYDPVPLLPITCKRQPISAVPLDALSSPGKGKDKSKQINLKKLYIFRIK